MTVWDDRIPLSYLAFGSYVVGSRDKWVAVVFLKVHMVLVHHPQPSSSSSNILIVCYPIPSSRSSKVSILLRSKFRTQQQGEKANKPASQPTNQSN
jgi:hypothetical protein